MLVVGPWPSLPASQCFCGWRAQRAGGFELK
jgi:hypothetical protein